MLLALATAAHSSQNPTETLIVIAAVGAAIFWRALIKISFAFIVILFAVLLIFGMSAFVQDLHL